MKKIEVRGARTHNLKNIDLAIPRNQLVLFTGLSGSGKSSLVFDTLYAEGQRRYVESLSAYARQFLSLMEKPDVDHISGLSPAIAIEQKSTSHNPRSTVGTITEIYDYLRLLFARVGVPYCPTHHVPLTAQTVTQMVDQILINALGKRVMLLAPVVIERKGEHTKLLETLAQQGYIRVRINGKISELPVQTKLDKNHKHMIEVVVDRFQVRAEIGQRLAESLETTLKLTDGIVKLEEIEAAQPLILMFSANFACPFCGYSISELSPRLFSFNNPAGACETCSGLGCEQFFDIKRVVIHPQKSLLSGAIRGFERYHFYYAQMFLSLAEHYQFDIQTPFNELNAAIQKIILYGSGEEKINFRYGLDRNTGKETIRYHAFEGLIANMERRYRDTESNVTREELAKMMGQRSCQTCAGTRLRQEARAVLISAHSLPQITQMSIHDSESFFQQLTLTGQRAQIAAPIIKEICARLQFLLNVGLSYLTLARTAETLSGGEAQRIRLASQIGSGLVGVMYVLDEPSIGLHQRDNARLLSTLTHLRDLGNSMIVVEHDEEAIRLADYIVDIGPGAGIYGGEVVAQGDLNAILAEPASLTGQFLSGKKSIAIPLKRHQMIEDKRLVLCGATGNNLQNVTLTIPVGLFCCITGVSGSGKSTLINRTLYPVAQKLLNNAYTAEPAPYESIEGLTHFESVIDIDQSPIGRTPRSNPATYTGLFTPIRELFASTAEARSRGYSPGRFSFNVKGGRCEACQGDGSVKVEMHFLADIYVACDECKGKRYNRETLTVMYKNKNIHEVLSMSVTEAHEFFAVLPAIARKLHTMIEVGLGYLTLGQSATTLSGGEAQRVKLAKELSKRNTGKTLYILDEPTTGLHFADIAQLLAVLHQLRDQGNTIVVIEHNLDVIKTADWIVDMGPDGGGAGGMIVVAGTPEAVAACDASHTGQFLKKMLANALS